jgi:hypothetical protein
MATSNIRKLTVFAALTAMAWRDEGGAILKNLTSLARRICGGNQW